MTPACCRLSRPAFRRFPRVFWPPPGSQQSMSASRAHSSMIHPHYFDAPPPSWSHLWTLSPAASRIMNRAASQSIAPNRGECCETLHENPRAFSDCRVVVRAADSRRRTALPRFRTVYILEMSNGLDQHLANRLTGSRVMWVVLEPKRADAVLTESLDESFWSWLAQDLSSRLPAQRRRRRSRAGIRKNAARQLQTSGHGLPGGSARQVVLWSAWENPKNPSPVELGHSAERIANQLKSRIREEIGIAARRRPHISRRPAGVGHRRDWRGIEARSWRSPLPDALAGARQQDLKRGALARGAHHA